MCMCVLPDVATFVTTLLTLVVLSLKGSMLTVAADGWICI